MPKILNKIVWLIIAAPLLYLAIIWRKLPDRIPIHFDLKGHADRIGSKNELLTMVLILSLINIIIYLLVSNIYRFDPKKYAADNKNRLNSIAFAVSVFFSVIVCMIIYTCQDEGITFNIKLILAGVGLLFAFIGNYMPNMKPNYFAGFRMPWTLENPDNWKKTHALAGKLWFFGGLLIMIVCLFIPTVAAMVVFFTIMLIMIIIPAVYSYRLYKKNKSLANE